MERTIKNKQLYRSATALLHSMKDKHSKWEKGIGSMQYQAQEIDTKRHFWNAIDSMKAFIDNID